MPLNIFLKGLSIGFAIAAPVGPIGVLCIRRSLAEGMGVGLATGLGAATADATYGAVAGFGLTAISSFLQSQRWWLGLIGGLFLCYLGVRTFFSKPAGQAAEVQSSGWVMAFVTTLVLTITNPMTILFFLAVFTRFGLGSSPDYLAASQLVAGVFLGSALWWLLLSGGVGWFRTRVGANWMQAVNRLSGAAIIAFGIYTLATLKVR